MVSAGERLSTDAQDGVEYVLMLYRCHLRPQSVVCEETENRRKSTQQGPPAAGPAERSRFWDSNASHFC